VSSIQGCDECSISQTEILARKQVAMQIAQAPAKSLPMQAIMMYMTGSSVSIITIMIVSMSFMTPIKALMSIKKREF
jgi:ER membrane protein complex subunit 4